MLIVTIVSLLMAAVMGWLALRLLREEQQRSDARVAALSAALEAPEDVHPITVAAPRQDVPRLTETPAVPVVPAAAPPPAAATARPAAPPAVVIPPPPPEIVAVDVQESDVDFGAERLAAAARPATFDRQANANGHAPVTRERPMFGDARDDAPTRDDRRWLAVAAVALVAVAGIAGARALWAGDTAVEASPAAVVAPGVGGVPIELVSLGYERAKDALVIRGFVRNPASGSARAGTSASVFLFDGEGGFLGSGRGVLDTPKLGAGDEAGFEIRLPANEAVRRYRVTFRSPEGDVVPHLDRRDTSLAAANAGPARGPR